MTIGLLDDSPYDCRKTTGLENKTHEKPREDYHEEIGAIAHHLK